MKEFHAALDAVRAYRGLGYERTPGGAELIARAPHVAPEAYLHEIYPPLDAGGIREVEALLGRGLPRDFADFLSVANGCYLYSGALSIFGLRREGGRSVDESRQPFDLALPNRLERLKDAAAAFLFVGFYDWDGSLLYIDPASNRTFRCGPKSARPLNEWPDFGAMLLSEVKRLAGLFDAGGCKRDPAQPTVI